MTVLDNYLQKSKKTQTSSDLGGSTTLDTYLNKKGVTSLEPTKQYLTKRDKEQDVVNRFNTANENVKKNLEKFQEVNKGGFGSKVLGFLGFDTKQSLPQLAQETPEYTQARQQTEQEAAISQDVNKNILKYTGQSIAKTGEGAGKFLLAGAKTSTGIGTAQDYATVADTMIGAGKNIGQLASGVGKVAMQAGLLPSIAGNAIGNRLFGKTKNAQLDLAQSFVDESGILNYKPKYANEQQKTGGDIAEIGSWFIPVTRVGKIAKIEQAIADIPRIEKIFGSMPKIVNSGGKLFYEIAKDTADIAVLDAVRGKNWDEIKSDIELGAAGSTVLRGAGEILKSQALRKKLSTAMDSITKSVGDMSSEEAMVVDSLVRDGKPLDEIASTIFKKRESLGEPMITPSKTKLPSDEIVPKDTTVTPKEVSVEKGIKTPVETKKPVETKITPKETAIKQEAKKSISPIIERVNKNLDEASKLDEKLSTTSHKEQLKLAEENILKDPEKAYNDAVFGETKLSDPLKTSQLTVLFEHAKLKGDKEAMAEIGTALAKHGRKSGQEIEMIKSMIQHNPTNKAIVDLAKVKMDSIATRFPKLVVKKGEDVMQKANKVVKDTSKRILLKERIAKVSEARNLIKSLTC